MTFKLLLNVSLLTLMIFTAATAQDSGSEQEQKNQSKQLTEPGTTTTGMTQTELKKIITEIAENVQGSPDHITFYYNGANMELLSNVPANRMRIIAPVVSAKGMNEQQILASLVSNYHLALDARYAIGDGVLYSVYIHPLKELTDEQLVSAVRQVATLRNTFGTSYTSGELSFGVQAQKEGQIEL